MSTEVEVAAVQIAAEPGAVEHNLARFARQVRALGAGVDLIVAPELLATGYDLAHLADHGPRLAERLDGPTVTLIAELAAETGATIVAGLLEEDDGALYDSVAVVDPAAAVSVYRKTHLYPPERSHFAEGDRLVTVATAAGRVGPMICFEHAFPEIATALALAGAQILAIPSAVPYGYEHLLSLRTRARAQDNQVFAVAANLGGERFCGGSMIVDPRGTVLAVAGTADEAVRATIDLDAIDREREGEPALRLRRPGLYALGGEGGPAVALARERGSR
jgi:predicted amidohydrolase